MADRWFKDTGAGEGARTLAEQMLGLETALHEAVGCRVLDLGCAEGLIAREFARAGAVAVDGVEYLQRHVDVGRELCAGYPVNLLCADLNYYAVEQMALEAPRRYEVVLALAVLHKLHDPEQGLRFAAWSARRLLVIRMPAYAATQRGVLHGKRRPGSGCVVDDVLRACGMRLECKTPGPQGEPVLYYRRVA